VVFDFYGTLTVGRSARTQVAARAEQAAALGVDREEYDRLLTVTYRDRFRGLTGGVRQSLAWAAAQLGVVPDEEALDRAEQVRLASERRLAEPRPEAVPLLHRLRGSGLRIGVVSDCTAELPIFFDELPIAALVDAAVFSCQSGHVKPDPPNYLECCARLDVEPQQCVYVGDGGSNELYGAAQLGMLPVHLDVPVERGDVIYGRHAAWSGESIAALPQLLPLLATLSDSTS